MNKIAGSIFAAVVTVLIMGGVGELASAGRPKENTFDINITHGRVPRALQLIRVKQGAHVKLRWTTDEPMILHLHGYDIEQKVRPSVITELVFEARATGRFPVNVHGAGKHSHGHSPEGTLLYIEVHPR
ncbi:MAG: hypothetical protein ACE5K1_11420 [Acidiferrobacterales bacterium]